MQTRDGVGPLLALDEIVMTLPGRRRVLDGATLRVAGGSTVCLAGANGAGKTTLLRVAAGVLEPQHGTVRIGDLDARQNRRDFSRQLGFLTSGGIEGRLSVAQNLELWAALSYMPKADRSSAVARTLETFELSELADRRSDRLSLGQRQRVRVALNFVHEPAVVLLDEPHTSLDDAGIAVLGRAMAAVAARGGVAVWAAPSPGQADLPHDRVAIVRDSEVVEG